MIAWPLLTFFASPCFCAGEHEGVEHAVHGDPHARRRARSSVSLNSNTSSLVTMHMIPKKPVEDRRRARRPGEPARSTGPAHRRGPPEATDSTAGANATITLRMWRNRKT